MNNTLIIKGRMTDLNTYVSANRTHLHVGAKIKKQETALVRYSALSQKIRKFAGAVEIAIKIYTDDLRQDEDNLFIYSKAILDGLKDAGIIVDDSRRYVHIKQCEVFYDGKGARVEVTIEEA